MILIGFPIPVKYGEDVSIYHWQPLKIPEIARVARGSSLRKTNAYGFDREHALADVQPLLWGTSENWSRGNLLSRGELAKDITSKSILILGCGALASPVAEALVRGGVTRIGLMDADSFVAGNMVRHVLDSQSLGKNKAQELAKRLNRCSIYADVTVKTGKFPPSNPDISDWIQEFDVVLDITADETVPQEMQRFTWTRNKWFFSIWIGVGAKRLYVFRHFGPTFDDPAYVNKSNRWFHLESEAASKYEFPRDGAGCWHPTFPANQTDIMLQAATATKCVVESIASNQTTPLLSVFEFTDNGEMKRTDV